MPKFSVRFFLAASVLSSPGLASAAQNERTAAEKQLARDI
jgi:hypothetical protein